MMNALTSPVFTVSTGYSAAPPLRAKSAKSIFLTQGLEPKADSVRFASESNTQRSNSREQSRSFIQTIGDILTYPFRLIYNSLAWVFGWITGERKKPPTGTAKPSKTQRKPTASTNGSVARGNGAASSQPTATANTSSTGGKKTVVRGAGRNTTIAAQDSDAYQKLQKRYRRLRKENRRLTQDNQALQTFRTILNGMSDDQVRQLDTTRQSRLEALRTKIQAPVTHPIAPAQTNSTTDPLAGKSRVFDLPSQVSTPSIRVGLPIFDGTRVKGADVIRTLKSQGRVSGEIPVHGRIRPDVDPNPNLDMTDPEIRQFLADGEQNTKFKFEYGDSSLAEWTEDKTARDLLQNFYDGHGHTLEGVKYDVHYNPATKSYKVRISGQGEFQQKCIEDYGAGNKRENPYNAGGYGEGAKMLSYRMVSKFGVKEIAFQSGDWRMGFKLGNKSGDSKKKDYIYKTLKQVPPIKGNFVEFETQDENLVSAVFRAMNYFYHPENKDFQAPTFENDHFGFKILPTGQNGNVYLANQRFEYGDRGKWANETPHVSLWFKRKPNAAADVSVGRDRTFLTNDDLSKLLNKDFVKTMTNEQIVQAAYDLKNFWSPVALVQQKVAPSIERCEDLVPVRILGALLSELGSADRNRNGGLRMPKNLKCVALPEHIYGNRANAIKSLVERGYTMVHHNFAKVGVPTMDTVLDELGKHQGVRPTIVETKRMNLLKEAATVFLEDQVIAKMQKSPLLIRKADVDQPIYLFDYKAEARAKVDQGEDANEGSHVYGQAITEYPDFGDSWHAPYTFKGCWIDRTHLNTHPFEEVLATYLHELTHQYGGDGDKRFGYRLTDWMREINASMIRNPQSRQRLHDILTVWESLGQKSQASSAA